MKTKCGLTMVILLITASVFAENPLIGTWKAETIGSKNPATFIFQSDGKYIFENNGNRNMFLYSYDENQKSMKMYYSDLDYLNFTVYKDNLDIYLKLLPGQKFGMIDQMKKIYESLRGINKISDMFVDEMGSTIANIFEKIPLYRLYK